VSSAPAATVAVVIPSHNRHDALLGAMASVAAQTVPVEQVIVVDDGSQPPVDPALLPGLPQRVQVLRNDAAQGANAARNRGWRAAGTDWVAFLDDDDRFVPTKIARLHGEIAAHPQADVLYHTAWIRMVNEGVGYRTAPKDLATVADPYHELLVGNYLGGTPTATVRRSLLERADGFDESLPSMQDYDLWLHLARLGANFRYIDEVLTLCRYTTAGGGISTNVDKHFAAAAAIEAKHQQGYATLTPAQRQQHELFVLNVATHRALMAGDVRRARQLQRQVLRTSHSPAAVANALVTMLGPKAAFRVRSMISRGPTAAKPQRSRR
jgi:glycosyltransferase involved in cell wall biosynthesis